MAEELLSHCNFGEKYIKEILLHVKPWQRVKTVPTKSLTICGWSPLDTLCLFSELNHLENKSINITLRGFPLFLSPFHRHIELCFYTLKYCRLTCTWKIYRER
jgi:hypothetical protein